MKVCIITLGCKVNQYESNQMVTKYVAQGFKVVQKFEPDADEYIVNACAVTANAEKKTRNIVARCKRALETQGKDPTKITICGCGIDRTLNDSLTGWAVQPRKRAFIKVQDGCNNFCSYCVIPYLRGRSRSRQIPDIIAEIQSHGKPVVLTGIDLSSFGLDNGQNLKTLCIEVDKCGVPFELSSIEVGVLTEGFLSALKNCENFVAKFHVPLQSGSDKVLLDMNRKYTRLEFIDAIKRVRKFFPAACISTDVITGYPTETPYDLDQTHEVVKICDFAKVHWFPFSDRNLERFRK